jgi:regulator of protease activity HflC (stomatin/prohibitin superfamily)
LIVFIITIKLKKRWKELQFLQKSNPETDATVNVKKRKEKFLSEEDDDEEDYSFRIQLVGIVQWALLALFFIISLVASLTIVESGTVKVQKVFGSYLNGYISEGVHLINPFSTVHEVTIQRQHIDVNDGDSTPGMLCPTSDNVQMTVQANFAFSINKQYASWLRREVGSEQKVISSLLLPAAQSATRDASASFKLEDAQIKRRSDYEMALKDQFLDNIIASLPKGKGINDIELKNVIIVMPVQLKGVTADQKVANALSEKKAAEIDLERQHTLTEIAKEQANRMKNQGVGVSNMFNELPKGYSPEQMERVINALSNYKKAESIMKAVENNKLNTIIYEGTASRIPN